LKGEETIAAIATAPGRGAVGVVRVSGPDAWRIAGEMTGRTIRATDAGRFFRADFGDDGLVLVFKGPRSYTGEDVVEFQGHGGAVAPRRTLEKCLAAGARLARRGEFTLRAFLNGKLDLSAAEAVIDLVDAKTDRAADDAFARLGGALSRPFEALYAEALALSSAYEHLLDVDESEAPAGYVEGLSARAAALRGRIAARLATAHEGKLLREGALVVLAGAPNAGKSSLMNALLGERRAIVSDAAGTTRDFLEECADFGGWPVRLVDTAGLRAASDAVEREGVERAKDLMARADLVVALDCDMPGALRVHAKCDLDGKPGVSAKTGEGLAELKAEIVRRLVGASAHAEEAGADITVRQRELLQTAMEALEPCGDDPVLAANGLRRAAESLGAILGKTYSDDLLDALFSRFCVGK